MFTGEELNVRTAGAVELDCSAFSPDNTNFPELQNSGPAQLLFDILQFKLWNKIPIGSRVICSVYFPDYCNDPTLAHNKASEVGYDDSNDNDDAETICNGIVNYVGSPWNQ